MTGPMLHTVDVDSDAQAIYEAIRPRPGRLPSGRRTAMSSRSSARSPVSGFRLRPWTCECGSMN